jgi:hypothetical protein
LAGITFEGARDLFISLGYKRQLRPLDYVTRYQRDALASRIVEALPKDTWRAGGELIEDDNPDKMTAFEQAWEDLARRLQVWPTFLRADILAGLGRFSVILIGVPGEMSEPLPARFSLDEIAYLTPFGEDDVTIRELVRDPHDPNYGLPASYSIQRIGGTVASGVLNTRAQTIVDASRIIHVADGMLTDRIYGRSRLESVWNLLDDLQKVVGGGAEAFWKRAHQGYHFDLDKDLENLSAPDVQALKDKADDFANGMSRTLATKGIKAKVFGSDVADFSSPIDAIVTLIAGTVGIPKRILMGSERGELASSQDRTNWNDRITDRRTSYAEPQYVRAFVDLLIERGALPPPSKYIVRWPEIQFLTEQEQAAVATQWAALNKNQAEQVITANEIRDRILGLPALVKDPKKPDILPDARTIAAATKICEDVYGRKISYSQGLGLMQLLGMTEESAKVTLGPETDVPEPQPVPASLGGPAVPGQPLLGQGANPPSPPSLPNAPPGSPNAPPALPPGPTTASAKEFELTLDLPESLLLHAARPKRVVKTVTRGDKGDIATIVEEEEI